MARKIPQGFGEAAFVLTSAQGTDPFITTIGVSLINYTVDDYVDAANYLHAAYADNLMPYTTDSLVLDRVELSIGLADGSSGSVLSDAVPVEGDVAVQMAPIGMAAIGRKNSAQLGRKGRGRSFLPGVVTSEGVSLGGSLEPSFRTNLQGAWSAFLTELAALPVGVALPPVILHSDITETPTPITGGTVAPLVGWIRDRVY